MCVVVFPNSIYIYMKRNELDDHPSKASKSTLVKNMWQLWLVAQSNDFVLLQGGRTTRLDRKESYKAQRRSYAKEKKRVERELLSTFKDQSIIVLADWLKVRGTLKGWTKLWCILKPGLLLLYRSPKAKV